MKLARQVLKVALTASMMLFVACSSDDGDAGPSYDFIDQNAQGTINAKVFTIGEASAEPATGTGQTSFTLFNNTEDITEVCDFFGFGESVSVFFFLPTEVGVYELSFDLTGTTDSRTVTFFDPDGTLNIIATEGAVEILTVTDTEITGRIDARAGSDGAVNGNFTATRCL